MHYIRSEYINNYFQCYLNIIAQVELPKELVRERNVRSLVISSGKLINYVLISRLPIAV